MEVVVIARLVAIVAVYAAAVGDGCGVKLEGYVVPVQPALVGYRISEE